VYPFALGLYYSFTDYWLQFPKRFRFIWFGNYIGLLNRPLFSRALEFTIGYSLVAVIIQVGLDSLWRCSCTRTFQDVRCCAR